MICPETGTLEGGIVSAVLANVYLHYALDAWFGKVVKKHGEGNAFICRYTDDFVSGFRHEEGPLRILRGVTEKIGKVWIIGSTGEDADTTIQSIS